MRKIVIILAFFIYASGIVLGSCCTELLDSCPQGNKDGPRCNTVKIGENCEGDNECGTDNSVNNCGVWDWYQRCECNGQTCSAGSECCSGNCVDGYCCNSACGGTCDACNITGHEGTCVDDDSKCTGCKSCSGGTCVDDDTLCSGTTSSCYCDGGACQSCTDPGGCSYPTCIGYTCGTADYGTSHQCDSTWKCSSSSGDNNYGNGGDYRCQGYCDGSGNCDYAGNCSLCRTDSENSGDSGNQPTVAGSCIDYTGCSGGSCQSSTSTEYCWSSTWLREYYASSGSCTGYWKNCNDYDGWYNYGDDGPGCNNMNDPTAEYRDYSCSGGACTYSVTSTKTCDSNDGWYGGGNTEGCGTDPSSQKRDYYVNSAGSCTYTTTNCPTKNCDSSDICSNTCDGSVIKSYKDYYVISNTNTCTYTWGSTVEDCASKNTYESDGCWAYTTGGYIYDYITCSGGSCTYNTYYDSCSSYTLTEYCKSGISYNTGAKDCRDYDVVASDSDGDDSSINGNCDPGREGYCSNSNPDYCINKSAGSLISDYCYGAGAVGATYKEAIVSDINGNSVYESCTYKDYDPDTNSNTCGTCSLNWNWACSGGDCASSPDTCCGDDSSEYAITCSCNSNACSCSGDTQACCANSGDCVWNNGCYLDTSREDIDSDGIDEYCLAGTWYAYPNITSISKDSSPLDRDDEVSKFTPDAEIKITTVIYDQDNLDRDKIYITIYKPDGTIAKDQSGISINEKDITSNCEYDPDNYHWNCYYNYNPKDNSPIGDYDVKIKAVDDEGLTDEKTESNLFEVKDIYLTNLAHYGTTSDLHITGRVKYTTYDSSVSGETVKCYFQEDDSFSCTSTTETNGNFDCDIGALDKEFADSTLKTNTFICEIMDIDDIAGSGTYNIDIGLQATNHVWNSTSLYHDESASFNVTFKNIGELTFAKEDLYWEISSEDGANPETNEDCNGGGWVDACGHLGNYEGDPHNSCGCYIQFDQNLAPEDTVTYSGTWKAKYHEFGDYNFGSWVRFPNKETGFTSIVAGQSPVTVSVVDKPPENLNFISALPDPVDRDKETSNTNDIITIKLNATDIDYPYPNGLGDSNEIEKLYITTSFKSDISTIFSGSGLGISCLNKEMTYVNNILFSEDCTWNPPNNMPTSDLGKFDIQFKVDDNYGSSKTSSYSQNRDKFKVEDLNTTFKTTINSTSKLRIEGKIKFLSNNKNVKNANVHCSLNGNIFSSNFNPTHNSHNYGANITDSNGNFEITIIDPYLSTEREIFCVAQTPTTKIDGNYGFLPNISAEILKVNVTTPCYYWAENITKFDESKWINSSFILGETDNRFAIGNSTYIIIDLGRELPKGSLEVYADSGIDIYGGVTPNPSTFIGTTYGSSSNFTLTDPIRYLNLSKSGEFKIDGILAWSITHDIKYDQEMGINVTVKNAGKFNLSYTRIGINYTQGTNYNYYDPYNFLLAINKNNTKNFSSPASDFSYGKIDTIAHVRDSNVDTNDDSSYGDWWIDKLEDCKNLETCYDGFYNLENTQPYEIDITWYGNKDNRTIIDRNKENNQTADTIYFNISAKDRDGIYTDEELNITLRFRSDNGTIFTEGSSCNNTKMTHSGISSENYTINCSFNPPNWMEDKDLGYFDVEITIVDSDSNEVVSNFNTYSDLFKVEDIKIENLTWSGNTYNLTFSGHSFYISNNTNLSVVDNQSCVEPEIEGLNRDSNLINVRLCGTNNFTSSTCSIAEGKFNCTVIEIKITGKEMNISYVLTDNQNISGYYNLIINLTGNIHYLDVLDSDKFVNPKSNVTYLFYISNDGNINWKGYLQNQTRNLVYSDLENPLSSFIESLKISNPTSWIDLNTTREGFNISGTDTFCNIGNSSYSYLQSINVSDLEDKIIEDTTLLMSKNKGCNFTLTILNDSFGLIANSTNKIIPEAYLNCEMVKGYCPMLYTWHFNNVNVSNYTTIYLNLTPENNCGGDYLFGSSTNIYPNGDLTTTDSSCLMEDIFVYINKFKTLDPDNFPHFIGTSNETLGLYNYTGETNYFWPNYNNNALNIDDISSGGTATYRVAAIDITDYSLSREVVRGDRIIGKVRGYFVGSTDINYWEEVQGDTFKVTDNTTTGKFWVEKWNISDPTNPTKIGTEIGSETNPENMTWNPDFWEAKINSFDLSCDNESTIHRVYFLINWTDYNIYIPYVKGEFKPEFWPYFYQNLSIKCVSRELFEVNPEIANVALGEEDRDIYSIYIKNPGNSSVDVTLTINCNDYPDAINWLAQDSWTFSIPGNSANSRIVTLDGAPRVGNYKFSVSVRGDIRYDKKVYLNIFSEALGSNNLVYLLLLFSAVSILLIKRNYEQ